MTAEEINLHISRLETIHGDEPIRVKIALPWLKELLALRSAMEREMEENKKLQRGAVLFDFEMFVCGQQRRLSALLKK